MKPFFTLTLSILVTVIYSQNVGINENNPERALDINGTTLVERVSSSADPHLDLRDTGDGFSRLRFSQAESISDNFWLLAGRAHQENDPNSKFNIYYNGDSIIGNLLTVTGVGKTGINTSSPSDRLHINSNQGENALRVQVDGLTKLRVLDNGGVTIGVNNTSGVPSNGLFVNGNVGLGVNNPTDKLAVNGDIHIDGELKPDGSSGSAGQMLVSNGNGGMSWSSPCQYNRFQGFRADTSPHSWTVPAGVHTLEVEAWGAGGGGSQGGGGGSGAYIKAIIDVTPGATFTITIGMGGAGTIGGATSPAGSGGNTIITGGGVVITADGGLGASFTTYGNASTYSITPSTTLHLGSDGIRGGANEIIPVYSGLNKIKLGKGGDAYRGGKGGLGDIEFPTGTTVTRSEGEDGYHPGGGGGGGSTFGNDGADGYVIFRWSE